MAEAVELPLVLDEVIEFLDGTFDCLLKNFVSATCSTFKHRFKLD